VRARRPGGASWQLPPARICGRGVVGVSRRIATSASSSTPVSSSLRSAGIGCLPLTSTVQASIVSFASGASTTFWSSVGCS
jgi:hypothetical protein